MPTALPGRPIAGAHHCGELAAEAGNGMVGEDAASIAPCCAADAGDESADDALGTDGSDAGLDAGIAALDGITTAVAFAGISSPLLLQPVAHSMTANTALNVNAAVPDDVFAARDC